MGHIPLVTNFRSGINKTPSSKALLYSRLAYLLKSIEPRDFDVADFKLFTV